MKTIVIPALAVLSLTACGARAVERGPSVAGEGRTGTTLELVASAETSSDVAQATFPARLTATASPAAADRLAHRVSAELGGAARADLQLCVDGAGTVTRAEVVRGSGIAALDAAFVDAARAWRYEPLAAPSATACQKVEIAYRVR